MTRSKTTGWIDENFSSLVLVCVVGTCLCFAGLGFQQFQYRAEARLGSEARSIQKARYPIAVKMATDAQRRGVITGADLACYRDVRRCPKPKP